MGFVHYYVNGGWGIVCRDRLDCATGHGKPRWKQASCHLLGRLGVIHFGRTLVSGRLATSGDVDFGRWRPTSPREPSAFQNFQGFTVRPLCALDYSPRRLARIGPFHGSPASCSKQTIANQQRGLVAVDIDRTPAVAASLSAEITQL